MSAVKLGPPRSISRRPASRPGTSATAASTIARRSSAGVIDRLPSFCHGTLATISTHDVEVEGVADVDGGDEVADVRWVERAPEQPDAAAPGGRRACDRRRISECRDTARRHGGGVYWRRGRAPGTARPRTALTRAGTLESPPHSTLRRQASAVVPRATNAHRRAQRRLCRLPQRRSEFDPAHERLTLHT